MYKLVVLALIAASITADTLTAACPEDPYCRSCNSAKCALCAYSYADSNGICQVPTTAVDNCIAYSSATACATCDYGYYLSSNSCTAISTTNCEIVSASAPATCLGCANSLLVTSAGACTGGATCTLANCDICASNTNCYECDDKYSLTTSTATSTTAAATTCVAQPTSNCSSVASSSNTACGICDDGYSMGASAVCTSSSVQDNVTIFSAIVALFAFIKLIA